MKSIKLLSVVVTLFMAVSWNATAFEDVALNSSEKKLSILLKGYKKMTKAKVLSKKEAYAFTKKNGLTSKKLKITNVAVIQYVTLKNRMRTVYALEVNEDLNFFAQSNQYSGVLNQDDNGGSDNDEEDCEILTESCGGDGCSCYCVVYNTCDPDEIESDPDCCSDCSCDEDDEFASEFDNFMEVLMG